MLYSRGIRFISGKWFHEGIEIRDFNKYLYRIKGFEHFIKDSSDTKRVKDTFVEMYGEDGWWPEMPIIKEAKEFIDKGLLTPLAYPLSHKMLILIKLLLTKDTEYLVILCGIGGSGKSTFANIICQIFGNDTASLTLSDLSNDFLMAQGANSRLIYADELNSDELDNGVIKTLVSKQMVTINPKNEKPYQARWQGTLFFSCNTEPRLDLTDSGLVRRVLYFYMNEKIKNPNPSLQKKEFTHEEIVNFVAHALIEESEDIYDEFKTETHNLLMRNNSVYLCADLVAGVKDTPYLTYVNNCKEKGLRAMSEPKFTGIKELIGGWIDEDLPF